MENNEPTRMDLADKRFLVVGLARSGLAAANFLISLGAHVTVTDIQTKDELGDMSEQLSSPVQLSLGGHRPKDFVETDTIILSPGVPRSIPELRTAASAGIEIISEVELAYQFIEGTLIGVTGSNGKTTTATMIGAILEKAGKKQVVAGNIGTPLVSFVDDPMINARDTIFVVELSSFQLETIVQLKCKIALLLNIKPDHMDRYPDFDAYREAKSRIFENQGADDFAIVNADDPDALTASAGVRSILFPFSCRQQLETGAFLNQGGLRVNWKGRSHDLLPVADLKLMGTHNVENTLAAASAAYLIGVSNEAAAAAIREFPGVEHRLEFVRQHRGVDYYNDSKATNVDSAIRAIQAFDKPMVLIMGGLDKETDFSPLREAISANVVKVILLGKAAEKLAAVFSDLVNIEVSDSLEDAVKSASRSADSGQIVLLAPACASFDMFENYEHRGRAYKQAVQGLH
jgi:UDP-N-acetylmuramoylalanine--D-glutamate ligase